MSTRNGPRTENLQTLCAIAPCYNEDEGIRAFYTKLKQVLRSLDGLDHRIVFVDDGSVDNTLDVLNEIASEDDRVTVLSLSRNFGHQIALSAGLDAADGDAVVVLDSDLQHPPELIPQMVRLWMAGNDVVSAVRTTTADVSVFKRLSSQMFYRLINWLSDTQLTPGAADFCLLSRRAHQALRQMPERHRVLRAMISWIGFKRAYVAFEAPPRHAGVSKYSLRKMLSMAFDAVFSFSTTPIRLAIRVGVCVSALGACYLAYTVTRALWVGDSVPAWGCLISAVLILGGIQIGFTGLVGEYVARTFQESKRRPLYVLKQGP